MAGLQRSAVSFRRQGSSGIIWDDKLLKAELDLQQQQQPQTKPIQQDQDEEQQKLVKDEVKPSRAVGSVHTIERSRSNGGGRAFRTGKVSPAIEPPSPKVSACGFCGAFGKRKETRVELQKKKRTEMENESILKEWFERVDSEKTGSITATQLKSALSVGNLEFTISVVQQMIRMYDFDRNGTMSFKEFVALNRFLLQVQQAFSDLERDRGFLVPDDVYDALLKIGFLLDYPAFYTVCESFDQKKNGRFRLDDFISLCIFVHSARNLFDSFDTSKQGRVTLDLNQFIYCTANCRI